MSSPDVWIVVPKLEKSALFKPRESIAVLELFLNSKDASEAEFAAPEYSELLHVADGKIETDVLTTFARIWTEVIFDVTSGEVLKDSVGRIVPDFVIGVEAPINTELSTTRIVEKTRSL